MASASLLAAFEVVVLICCVCVTLVVQAARFIYTTFSQVSEEVSGDWSRSDPEVRVY